MNLMPFDELNTFRQMVTDYKGVDALADPKRKQELRDDLWEYIEYLLIEAYVYGNVQAMYDLGIIYEDPNALINADEMYDEINKKIAGKTYRDRIEEYLNDENSTIEDFMRVAETDSTRVYNAGVVDGGKNSGVENVMKRWVTVGDDRVRDTHDYLEGMTVPLNDDFYSYDNDHARAPGLFSDPANNVNCRCTVTLIRE